MNALEGLNLKLIDNKKLKPLIVALMIILFQIRCQSNSVKAQELPPGCDYTAVYEDREAIYNDAISNYSTEGIFAFRRLYPNFNSIIDSENEDAIQIYLDRVNYLVENIEWVEQYQSDRFLKTKKVDLKVKQYFALSLMEIWGQNQLGYERLLRVVNAAGEFSNMTEEQIDEQIELRYQADFTYPSRRFILSSGVSMQRLSIVIFPPDAYLGDYPQAYGADGVYVSEANLIMINQKYFSQNPSTAAHELHHALDSLPDNLASAGHAITARDNVDGFAFDMTQEERIELEEIMNDLKTHAEEHDLGILWNYGLRDIREFFAVALVADLASYENCEATLTELSELGFPVNDFIESYLGQ